MVFHVVKEWYHPARTSRQVLVPVTEEEFINASSLGESHFYQGWVRANCIDMLLRFGKRAEVTAGLEVPMLQG